MKHLLFLAAFLVLGISAVQAQTPATPLPTPATAPAVSPDAGAVLLFNGWYLPAYQRKAAEADTTGALLSLFRKRRYAGWLYVLPFMGGMMLALPVESTDRYGNRTVAPEAVSPPLGVAVLAGSLVGFVLHANKFNKAHLVAVDKAYAAGQPVPAKYRSQLNPSHFAEAAYLREALRQQMMREQQRKAMPTGE